MKMLVSAHFELLQVLRHSKRSFEELGGIIKRWVQGVHDDCLSLMHTLLRWVPFLQGSNTAHS